MKKPYIELYIEKLRVFEEKCDELLSSLHEIAILNLNLDTPQDIVIDTNSPDWQIFYNDLLALTKRYPVDINYDFERFILMFDKAVKCPNKQNISNLKVSIHSLRNHLIDTLDSSMMPNDIWNFIHPLIAEVSMQRFNDHHYADAVESAFKEVNTRVKRLYQNMTGEERDGADLMRKAFSPNTPILTFENLGTQTGKNVQQGYMEIFAGAITGIRNPKAHQNMYITETEAVQRLMLASLLMSKIDEAVKFMNISE